MITPSFFKIRLVIVAIFFVVFCFVVGFVKNVFAGTAYSSAVCRLTLYTITETPVGSWGYTGWTVDSDGNINPGSTVSYSTHTTVQHVVVYTLYSNGGSWTLAHSFDSYFVSLGEGISFSGALSTALASQTCTDCTTEAAQLYYTCSGVEGEAWEWTDKSTCTGHCISQCTAGSAGIVDIIEGSNLCLDGCEISIASVPTVPRYLASDGLYHAAYEATYTGDTCVAANDPNPVPDDTCTSLQAKCVQACGGSSYVYSFECELTQDSDGNSSAEIIKPCVCIDRNTNPSSDDDTESSTEKDNELENNNLDTDDKESVADSSGDTNEVLQSVKDNTDVLIEQNNQQKDLLVDMDNNLEAINSNAASTVTNTARIAELLDSDVKSGIKSLNDSVDSSNDKLDSLNSGIDSLNDNLNSLGNHTFTAPSSPDAYNPAPDGFSFSDRFDSFVSDMKQTAIFSLPNELIQNIPSGGSSLIEIDCGDTFGGVHSIDLSQYSSAIAILRTVYLIICSFVGIRIITLKGN